MVKHGKLSTILETVLIGDRKSALEARTRWRHCDFSEMRLGVAHDHQSLGDNCSEGRK